MNSKNPLSCSDKLQIEAEDEQVELYLSIESNVDTANPLTAVPFITGPPIDPSTPRIVKLEVELESSLIELTKKTFTALVSRPAGTNELDEAKDYLNQKE